MGPSQRQRRRLARCRWVRTVRTGYRAARRDHTAEGRLERHAELRVGGAAGGTTWLLYYRSRELIAVTTLVVAEAHLRALWPQRFGYSTRRGRIAKGMDADLVVLRADPEHDATAFSRVRYPIIGGKGMDSEPPPADRRPPRASSVVAGGGKASSSAPVPSTLEGL